MPYANPPASPRNWVTIFAISRRNLEGPFGTLCKGGGPPGVGYQIAEDRRGWDSRHLMLAGARHF